MGYSVSVARDREKGVFQRLRAMAPDFIDETAKKILARGPRIVGR